MEQEYCNVNGKHTLLLSTDMNGMPFNYTSVECEKGFQYIHIYYQK